MSDYVVIDGDALQFDPPFGNRQVIITGAPTIKGSGHMQINHKKSCIVGDEKRVLLQATYTMPGYTPGQGNVTITQLDTSQQAQHCRSGAPLIIKGQQFKALFTPTIPAQTTSLPPTPDTSPPSEGKGRFNTQQRFVIAG